jgi:hypothetical protein
MAKNYFFDVKRARLSIKLGNLFKEIAIFTFFIAVSNYLITASS